MQDSSKVNIAIFASGSGSNAQKLMEYFSSEPLINISLIITNQSKAGVVERARKFKIPVEVVSKEMFYESNLAEEILLKYDIHYIVLAGFLLKVPFIIIQKFPEKIINIHPALLPKFGGKGMYGMHVHRAVKSGGEKETGISIHIVNERYDDGRILFQKNCAVHQTDTPEDIQQNVQKLEHKYFAKIVHEYISKKENYGAD